VTRKIGIGAGRDLAMTLIWTDASVHHRYAQLLSIRPLTDLISDEQYKEYVTRLSAPEKVEGQEQESTPVEKSKEQLETEIRQLLLESCASVNARTGEETLKRWPFEAEIKRPYFHVKPMDMPQLTNWRRYLDFEETEGDVERIRVLYERCLVTCVRAVADFRKDNVAC